MTPGEFINTFLPNSSEKWEEVLSGLESGQMITLASIGFIYNHFEEALENFTNKICEKQRMECACSADIDWIDPFDYSAGHRGIDMKSILEANQPKIEDL